MMGTEALRATVANLPFPDPIGSSPLVLVQRGRVSALL